MLTVVACVLLQVDVLQYVSGFAAVLFMIVLAFIVQSVWGDRKCGTREDNNMQLRSPRRFLLYRQEVRVMKRVMCFMLTAVSDQQWIASNHNDPSLT